MDAKETVLDRLRKAMYETDGPEHLLEAAADYGLAIVLAARRQGLHAFRNLDPEAECPTCHFPAWSHDPAQAVLASRSFASPPEPEPLDVERLAAIAEALVKTVGSGSISTERAFGEPGGAR